MKKIIYLITIIVTIKKGSETQLEISDEMGSTMIACPKMNIETAFLQPYLK